MMENLELRMYGLVNYQLSDIQKGIQFGHSVVEYQLRHGVSQEYINWSQNWKTFIILSGGTTNNNISKMGTLNQHLITLNSNLVKTSEFYEPDIGDQLTAITFIVDERVFNKDKYPDIFINITGEVDENTMREYDQWVDSIGGKTNLFLREFIRNFKLA